MGDLAALMSAMLPFVMVMLPFVVVMLPFVVVMLPFAMAILPFMLVCVQGANQGLRLLPSAAVNPNIPFLTLITVMLVAGAAVLRWLAHSNETRGLGDGTTVLIALSIVTSELHSAILTHSRMHSFMRSLTLPS